MAFEEEKKKTDKEIIEEALGELNGLISSNEVDEGDVQYKIKEIKKLIEFFRGVKQVKQELQNDFEKLQMRWVEYKRNKKLDELEKEIQEANSESINKAAAAQAGARPGGIVAMEAVYDSYIESLRRSFKHF